jgi:hypothetical protein
MCVGGWERLAWKRWQHSHLPLLAGSRLAALGYPPPPGLRACSSSACINANAIERDVRVCNNEHALAIAAGAADEPRVEPARSAARNRPRAVLTGINACGYRRRSVMLQRVASCAVQCSTMSQNAVSSLRSAQWDTHRHARQTACVLGVRLRCSAALRDSRQRRRQEAEHNNVLPQASQNSGSEPKSA